jgi:hypothetical protein
VQTERNGKKYQGSFGVDGSGLYVVHGAGGYMDVNICQNSSNNAFKWMVDGIYSM